MHMSPRGCVGDKESYSVEVSENLDYLLSLGCCRRHCWSARLPPGLLYMYQILAYMSAFVQICNPNSVFLGSSCCSEAGRQGLVIIVNCIIIKERL